MALFKFKRILPGLRVKFGKISIANGRNMSSGGDNDDDQSICMKRVGFGLLLGVYSQNDGRHDTSVFTPTAEKYNKRTCGRLGHLLGIAGPCPKLGEVRVFYGLETEFSAVAVVGLGPQCEGYDEFEQLDKGKENIRVAAAAAAKALIELDMNRLFCESFGHAESCAEGAALAVWIYQEYKNIHKRRPPTYLELFEDYDWTGWQIGLQKAAAQNLARSLTEAPANAMTPILFAQKSVEILCKAGVNVQVKVRNWAELQGMGGFLAVSKGSCQEPIFMEISFHGTNNIKERPIVLIGKGCTFDSGGIGLRSPEELKYMRNDVAGAAVIVAAIRAVASLQIPLNIRGLIPLCEHMPGCNALKPGDVIETFSRKNVMVQDVRCEGRLMLADALSYAQTYWPRFILDVASLTKGVRTGLSTAATAVFTNSDRLWSTMQLASVHTGDRVWRFPLFEHYTKKMVTSTSFDLKNKGRVGPGGDPCRAAAFLGEFVPCGEWLHLDNYGVTMSDGVSDPPYLRPGMTGRPTRTLIEFLSQLVCKHES